jgi:hypothetical protein
MNKLAHIKIRISDQKSLHKPKRIIFFICILISNVGLIYHELVLIFLMYWFFLLISFNRLRVTIKYKKTCNLDHHDHLFLVLICIFNVGITNLSWTLFNYTRELRQNQGSSKFVMGSIIYESIDVQVLNLQISFDILASFTQITWNHVSISMPLTPFTYS